MRIRIAAVLLLCLVLVRPVSAADSPPASGTLVNSAELRSELLDQVLEIRLAPDLSKLTAAERATVQELLAVGELFQRIYESSRHPQALEAHAALEKPDADPGLAKLFRVFHGPIATTLDNRREPFLAVEAEAPGKNVYPWRIGADEVELFLTSHPEARDELLGERTVVRRATSANLARDRAAIDRHPVLAALHPELPDRLRALVVARDASALYAVPYSVAWADELVTAQRGLFRAADRIAPEDPEFARYLRNRGRDLLSDDYESGDAAWVTGRFGRLNAQIGAYETYDDALFGVKTFHALSLLLRDEAATAELAKSLGGLQEVEDALPYEPRKRVRADIPVGVYEVIADFGQARGVNTATILPNDALFSRRYGRTILLRENMMTHPELVAIAQRRWRAAVAPAHAGELVAEGSFQRTLWHEIGHYLGPDRTRDGRDIDQALVDWADAVEEMKSDLVSLFALQRFHEAGLASAERLRAVRASGVLRTLQNHRPRRDQPYQTMQLAQFNWFLDRGLLALDAEGRLEVRYERYAETVAAMLREVLELQSVRRPARGGGVLHPLDRLERRRARAARPPSARGRGPALPPPPLRRARRLMPRGSARRDEPRFACRRSALAAAAQARIETPGSAAPGRDVEEQEAVERRQLAAVLDRPEPLLRVGHEVGHGHHAAGEEGGIRSAEPEGDQEAAAELDDPAEDHQRVFLNLASEHPEQLLRAVAGEQEARHQPEEEVGLLRELGQESHRGHLCENGPPGVPRRRAGAS